MGALTVRDDRTLAMDQQVAVQDDAIVCLLERLHKLIAADGFLVCAFDPLAQAVSMIGSNGKVDSIAACDLASLRLSQRRSRAGFIQAAAASDAEISRLELDFRYGSVLSISVMAADVSIDIFATRAAHDQPFTVNEERAVRRMSGWIADYVRLWWDQHRDRGRGDSLQAALDLVGNAVIVTDGHGRLVNTNGAAQLLLDAGDGLRKFGNMLTAVSLEDAARLHTAIAHIAATSESHAMSLQAPVLSIRREGLRPLSVAVMRGLPASGVVSKERLVIIQAVDPQSDIEQSVLPACTIYGLTGAETRLAKLLVSGASLAEAAARLKIRVPTASTYLKHIFAKTGTNRQTALVLLLLTTVVRTAPSVTLTALQ